MESEKNTQNGTDELPASQTTRKRNKPNFISTLFIWWMCPVFINGNKRDVEEEDLIVPSKRYDSQRQGDYLESYWFEEVERALRQKRDPSLWSALWRAYWMQFMPAAIYVIIITVARTTQPLVFAQLLSYWSVERPLSRYDAGFYAFAMLGLNFIALMCQHHNSLFVFRFGMKVKVACSSLLFRKLLRLSQVSVGEVAGGKLVNLLSNDIARFDYAFMFLHYLWIVPIQAAVVLYFLYEVAGYAPFVGLFGVVLFILPLQAALTKLTAVIRRSTAVRTDKRIKLMNEVINGIQVIKMYAWEKPFQRVVKVARAYEMNALKKSMFVRSMFIGFMLFTEKSIMFFTILTLALTDTMISATIIYPIQQFFSIIQMNVTLILPVAIASFTEMLVSCERIQSFLILDERSDMQITPKIVGANTNLVNSKKRNSEPGDVLPKKYVPADLSVSKADETVQSDYPIEINRVSASWTNSDKPEEMTLKNISMRVRKGKLCAVIGPVGSGKTSLLQLLLKELPLTDGTLNVRGKVAYACQESWLFPGTVRENILFGLPYDVQKYKEVCKASSLLPDFKQFPYGDLSLVGERGVSLSGGQRARINLARAIYREADIYLLDDPLSAVDANVGRQLFDGCIKGYLGGRTCVLVTHQIHYLKAADYIVVLNNGSIENMGSYEELAKSGTEFSLLLSDQAGNGETSDAKSRPSMLRGISKMSVKSQDDDDEEKAQVLEAEERGTGSLKFEVIKAYLNSVQSWTVVILTLLAVLFTQASATTADYWLSFWTNQVDEYEQSLESGQLPDTSLDAQIGLLTTAQYLIIFGSVILGIIIISHLRILSFVIMSMRASKNLHNTIYERLIIAVMRFFDTNPSGRVLNRFSKDMGAIDEFLPRSFLETIQMYLSLASILTLNAIALPWTLIPTFVLLVIFVFLLRWYLNAAQAVKRLEGTTKSPVFGMVSSTISGLSTIRSANSQTRLLRTFDGAQDLHTSAFYTFTGGSSAFGMYLDGLCLAYLGIILAIFLLGDFLDFIPVGSVGLAVSQSMVLTMMLQMAARTTADFLGQMTAVERVLDYTKLPTEKNMDTGPTTPPNDWPKLGQVAFSNVYLNYSVEDPPVLKDLNFVINSGWKVGVVGRTGAGKSSLISALFRLSNITGQITIDGLDTEGIAKKVLRSKISIIPQEPVLFSATLRYNLDPFDDYSDEDIWRALEQVELKDGIQSLEFKVTEGGSNFSMGQRQLICLARAVLRSNKILIMDEATANVDPQTDALIQKTIRREFATCTVLTIAHRLNTIMDSDRVLVMDKGEAVEFDHPHILLSDPNSVFSSMVRETGENMAKILFDVAKNKYDSDNKTA
ncbi:multidrug resistance-associated protein 4-like [Trichoplusia ni]|uniref:Multidrug resistance-associated protein 4-like n=2 Tax=Trichoplusia ni TaxID=7111 RepID=A0A7E5VCQ6_TRINI|nr:multidrug resistance-associated protein 4-like [Trichoplusia ni]UWI80168.1 ABCC3 [Trichoplusia ni]UWI80169.1 ABCC3 [Trichoplusia ni]UWI80170.1 ABCC3 [Trichoplusia ni]UWI80171.1 ABCC3 [Trichoplusia ni]UWI80204.1 ABCC3 [Trichoplusia ni]